MKVIDPKISGKAFATLAEKATQLIDMIDGTLRNPESPALLASLLLPENQRAILVIFTASNAMTEERRARCCAVPPNPRTAK